MRFAGPWVRKAAFVAGALCVLLAILRRPEAAPKQGPSTEEGEFAPNRTPERGSILPRPLASVFVAIFLFVAGAALGGAFAASADDGALPEALSDQTTTVDTSSTTVETTTADSGTGTDASATSTASEPAATTTTAEAVTEPEPTGATSTNSGEADATTTGSSEAGSGSTEETPSAPAPGPVLTPHKHRARTVPAETAEGGAAVIWLHRTLPDPTPPARRLSPEFAELLRATADANGVHWWLVLAVLRAHGHAGRVPATLASLEALAGRLSDDRMRVTARIRALARYNRAVGLRALVTGLEAAKPRLERRILNDPRIDVYPGGVADITAGRVDVRVLVVIRYLTVTFHQVSVTSLVTGHRLFARPGVVSAHVYGLAVDVAALAGTPIDGHQQPGGITQHGVEALLRLPAEVQPQQIISLLGLGGPSFPLADHYDHIHVGF